MKNIIFIAPPASGKGTFSKILEENFGYKHLALGDVLRSKVDSGDLALKELLDNGKLVSDEIIMSIIKEKINELKGNPFIIDGCPRTLIQAQLLQNIFEEEMVTDVAIIKFNIDVDTAKQRILGRLVCKCGKSYNINSETLKPKVEGICDICSNVLTKRTDDTEEKIINRFNEFENNIKPIKEFYESKKMLFEIDGTLDVDSVLSQIKDIIND